MRAVYIFEPPREKKLLKLFFTAEKHLNFQTRHGAVLTHFSLVSVQRRLQPPTSHQARGQFSLCCYTEHGLMLHVNPLGWVCPCPAWCFMCFPREKSCSWSVLVTPSCKRARSDFEESAWTQASATAFGSAKQNRFNLVHHMVGRIVSLEIESEPSLFHVAEITDTRFSTTFQQPD